METKAVRLYGKNDLRLEQFELPPIGSGEILAEIVSDSICMSSYKAAIQGADHKRVSGNDRDRPGGSSDTSSAAVFSRSVPAGSISSRPETGSRSSRRSMIRPTHTGTRLQFSPYRRGGDPHHHS
jgi:hypothetical protein